MPFLTREKLIDQLNLLKLSPQKSQGQNYLIDSRVCQSFVDEGEILLNQEDVLEIGPGLGAFSDILAKRAHNLVLIERNVESARFLESHFRPHYSTQYIESRQIKFLGFIPIKSKITIVEGNVLEMPVPKVDLIIANLPFQLSVEIFIHLIANWQYRRVLFILQKEFVKHLMAKAGHPHYTFISAIVGFYFNVEILRELPMDAFYPKPNVNLMSVKFTPKPALSQATNEFEHRIEFIEFLKKIMPLKNKRGINAIKAFLKQGEIDSVHEAQVIQELLKIHPEWSIYPLKKLIPLELYSLMLKIQAIENKKC